ncbi:MAG: hypothetical protein Unbinned3329contig1000_20 [Prokaryotic dsDNA virus sp.]|jgi:chaperonin cofactor prefoldin|nr:MAG: hypothetical protein Unbinned3329contig1000_20 [Prokaryotic dsDNA virus sp.]|tara:strand:- start:1223 stop:1426 length:204 start_codon:yes stop_codon:yes gene_type:complete
MSERITAKDVLARMEKHESECTIRWQNVERQLEKGAEKMQRLENRIYGFNAILLTGIVTILVKLIGA